MAWDDNLSNLNRVLAELYPDVNETHRIVDDAGLTRSRVAFNPRAIDNWHAILAEADKQGKVAAVIKVTRRDYPDNTHLEQAQRGRLTPTKSPIVEDADLSWKTEESPDTLEKIMGKMSTLLPISFLEGGLQRAHSVSRVKRGDGLVGTGFLIKDNLLVTNNHVLGSEAITKLAQAEFNYQRTWTGLNVQPTSFKFEPENVFITSEDDDWTVVKVAGDANAKWGAIELTEVDINQLERVNIIQHPGGGPKQIALYHNLVAHADDKRIQYLTDTLPGSSGSPVFDSRWNLVALHHSGGWIREPGTKRQVYRNEGINTNLIRERIIAVGLTD